MEANVYYSGPGDEEPEVTVQELSYAWFDNGDPVSAVCVEYVINREMVARLVFNSGEARRLAVRLVDAAIELDRLEAHHLAPESDRPT